MSSRNRMSTLGKHKRIFRHKIVWSKTTFQTNPALLGRLSSTYPCQGSMFSNPKTCRNFSRKIKHHLLVLRTMEAIFRPKYGHGRKSDTDAIKLIDRSAMFRLDVGLVKVPSIRREFGGGGGLLAHLPRKLSLRLYSMAGGILFCQVWLSPWVHDFSGRTINNGNTFRYFPLPWICLVISH